MNPILQHFPYSVIHLIKVWAVRSNRRPQFWCYEIQRLPTRQLHGRFRTVRQHAILFKLVPRFMDTRWNAMIIENIVKYTCAKFNELLLRFDKVIVRIKWCILCPLCNKIVKCHHYSSSLLAAHFCTFCIASCNRLFQTARRRWRSIPSRRSRRYTGSSLTSSCARWRHFRCVIWPTSFVEGEIGRQLPCRAW